MAVANNFTEHPPQTNPGDCSFSSTIQYGLPQEISWTGNYYSFPLNLFYGGRLSSCTTILADLKTKTLAYTVPLLSMPVNRREESGRFVFFSFSQPLQYKLLLGRRTNAKPFSN